MSGSAACSPVGAGLWRARAAVLLAAVLVASVTPAISAPPARAAGAVAFDHASQTSGDAGSFTLQHTVTTEPDRLLLVAVSFLDVKKPPTSVSYGDQPLTQVADAAGDVGVRIFELADPPTGDNYVVVTMEKENKAVVGAASFYGVDTSDPTDGAQSATGKGDGSSTITVTSETGDMVFDVLAVDKSISGPMGADQTELWIEPMQSGKESGASTASGTPSRSMNWTFEKGKYAHAGININAARDTTPPTVTGPSGATGTSSAVTIDENSTAVHGFSANEDVTWSLTGGADQERFTIVGTSGELAFVDPPDFESPADADGDNRYLVEVTATDPAGNATGQTVTVTVADVEESANTVTEPEPEPEAEPDPRPEPEPEPDPEPDPPLEEPVMEPDGSLSELEHGEASMMVDGEPVEVDVVGDGSSVHVTGGGIELSAQPASGGGAPSGTVVGTTLNLVEGGAVSLRASGFQPGSVPRLWLFSEPILLGDLEVGDDGTIEDALAPLPDDVLACSHTLQIVGTTSEGKRIVLSMGVRVSAHPYPYIDADPSGTHGHAIGCITDLGLAVGFGGGIYGPDRSVTRGQLASMLVGTLGIAPAQSAPFSDVDGGVHAGAIGALAERGIIDGYADGSFRPAQAVTWGQVATMLARALDLESDGQITASDPRGSVHAGAIAALTKRGVLPGSADTTRAPQAMATRAQIAALLVGVLEQLESAPR